MRNRLISPLLICSVLVLPLASCSKKDDQVAVSARSGVTPLFQEALLKKVPPATAAVAVFDFSGEGFQRMKKLPVGKNTSWMNQLTKAAEQAKGDPARADLGRIVEALIAASKESGLVSADGTVNYDAVVSKSVVFVAPEASPEDGVPAVGAFFTAASGTSLKSKLPTFKKVLESSYGQVTPVTVAGAEGFQAGKTLVVATDNLMAVTSSRTAAERLFGQEETTGMSDLMASPEMKQLEGRLSSADPAVQALFVSTSKLAPILEKLAKAAGDDSTKLDLKENPVDGLSLLTSVKADQLVSSVGVGLTGRTEGQKKVLSALESATLPGIAGRFPADSAFTFSLDLKALEKADDVWAQMAAEGDQQAQVDLLKSIKGVSLAVRSNDAGSPIPDVFLAVESAQRDQLATQIESLVGQGMGGGQGIPWQEKKIGETPTRYFMTPLGAGLFMARPTSSAQTLVAASSERALKDQLAVASGASKGINSVVKSGDYTAGKTGELFAMYINFVNTATMLEGVKSSLAMFTGGSKELDEALDTAAIRTMGNAFLSVGYAKGVLGIDSIQSAAQ